MNAMNYDRVTLKSRARASLREANTRPWKVMLVFALLAGFLPGIVVNLLPDANRSAAYAMLYDMIADRDYMMDMIQRWGYNEVRDYYRALCTPALGVAVFSYLVSLLLSFFKMVMNFGHAHYALKLYRHEDTRVNDVFHGFSMAGQAIGTGIMTGLFTLLWMLPVLVVESCALILVGAWLSFSMLSEAAVELLMLVLIGILAVALIVYVMFISYRYSLAPYFILNNNMGIMDAIRESKNAMESKTAVRSNLGRRFMLDLSFLGWELLVTAIILVVAFLGIFITYALVRLSISLVGWYHMDWNVLTVGTAIGVVLSVVLGVLAALPLELWLAAYHASAEAGFFLAVTGQDREKSRQPGYPYAVPQPPRSPVSQSVWDNVPTPPPFTPPAPPPTPPAETPAAETETPKPEGPADNTEE